MGVVRSADYLDNAVLRGRSAKLEGEDEKITRSSCYLDSGVLRMRSQRSDGTVDIQGQYLDANGVRRWRRGGWVICMPDFGGFLLPPFMHVRFPSSVSYTLSDDGPTISAGRASRFRIGICRQGQWEHNYLASANVSLTCGPAAAIYDLKGRRLLDGSINLIRTGSTFIHLSPIPGGLQVHTWPGSMRSYTGFSNCGRPNLGFFREYTFSADFTISNGGMVYNNGPGSERVLVLPGQLLFKPVGVSGFARSYATIKEASRSTMLAAEDLRAECAEAPENEEGPVYCGFGSPIRIDNLVPPYNEGPGNLATFAAHVNVGVYS